MSDDDRFKIYDEMTDRIEGQRIGTPNIFRSDEFNNAAKLEQARRAENEQNDRWRQPLRSGERSRISRASSPSSASRSKGMTKNQELLMVVIACFGLGVMTDPPLSGYAFGFGALMIALFILKAAFQIAFKLKWLIGGVLVLVLWRIASS